MLRVSNLRKESKNGGWTYLCCDFDSSDMATPFPEKTMWIAVQDEHADMLTDEVYDPFVLLPLFLGMYYGQDVHICGKISPRLYHNITHYVMSIFDLYSDHTRPVKFTVDGFDTLKALASKRLIGTGISCGVDSMLTIYDNFVEETDPAFKINSLFFFNCGSHGDFGDEKTRRIWLDRAALNGKAAEELGLPMFLVDSNLHAYTHIIGGQKMGYLAFYSCELAMQKYIKRYVTSSTFSYDESAEYAKLTRDFDMAENCESYMLHLISTECFELVIDGCQYTRAEKIERICNWSIAQKYLNVCVTPAKKGHNCSNCEKCMRTLISLEAIGKLDDFKDVFDIDEYKKNAAFWKARFMSHYGKNGMETSIMNHAKQHGLQVPNQMIAKPLYLVYGAKRRIKRLMAARNAGSTDN